MPSERLHALTAVLTTIRRHPGGVTLPTLTQEVGLGRSVVSSRVADLETLGLVVADGLAPSTGGRAPRLLRLRAEAGLVCGVAIGALGVEIGVADLAGRVLTAVDDPLDVTDGPDAVLDRVEQLVDDQLGSAAADSPVWGIGIGVPGPVEFATGRPVAPPIMPGWDGYPIRQRLTARYGAPTWVDNDVNILALGELRAGGHGSSSRDMIYVKIGTGIGAGLVSDGRLHRGANGSAGDIGHVAVSSAENVVCRCGNVGCLEALAGGAALALEGRRIAETGGSAIMAEMLSRSGTLTAADVVSAAERGDPSARGMLTGAGRLVGTTLASLVSLFNPSLVVLGGGVVRSNDQFLAAIRESVYRRSLPLATRSLRIEPASVRDHGGLVGAVHLALDQIFSPACLQMWALEGSPAGLVDLADQTAASAAA